MSCAVASDTKLETPEGPLTVKTVGNSPTPVMICGEALASGRLVEVLEQARLPVGEIYAVYPSRRFQATKVKTFLDFLMASLPSYGGRLLEPAGPGLLTSHL